MDYEIFYKKKIEKDEIEQKLSSEKFNLFISAYNESNRIKYVFDNVIAEKKHWLIFPEYNFSQLDLIELNELNVEIFNFSEKKYLNNEDLILVDYVENNIETLNNGKVLIDITGFLRPHLVFLVRLLKIKQVSKISFLYSEPMIYKKKENTVFSDDFKEIKEISGCLGSHNPETSNDILIVGSGYDFKLISRIANFKAESKKIQVLGFPPLQADMFQENILKAYQAEDEVSSRGFSLDDDIILSPANDPFVTAKLISDFIKKEEKRKKTTNIYLCPLSTKPQTLGFALYFVNECLNKPVSMIFPYCSKYSSETTEGISRVWIYTVEF